MFPLAPSASSILNSYLPAYRFQKSSSCCQKATEKVRGKKKICIVASSKKVTLHRSFGKGGIQITFCASPSSLRCRGSAGLENAVAVYRSRSTGPFGLIQPMIVCMIGFHARRKREQHEYGGVSLTLSCHVHSLPHQGRTRHTLEKKR